MLQIIQWPIPDTKRIWGNSGFYWQQWMSYQIHCFSFVHLFFPHHWHSLWLAGLALKMGLCSGKWLKSIIIFIISTMKIILSMLSRVDGWNVWKRHPDIFPLTLRGEKKSMPALCFYFTNNLFSPCPLDLRKSCM